MRKLSAVIYPDTESDWLIAYNPETGTTTEGKSPAKALANLKEATGLYLTEFPLWTIQHVILKTFTVSNV